MKMEVRGKKFEKRQRNQTTTTANPSKQKNVAQNDLIFQALDTFFIWFLRCCGVYYAIGSYL